MKVNLCTVQLLLYNWLKLEKYINSVFIISVTKNIEMNMCFLFASAGC